MDPLPYGLEPNRAVLEQLMRHAVDQHLLERPLPWRGLFAESTRTLMPERTLTVSRRDPYAHRHRRRPQRLRLKVRLTSWLTAQGHTVDDRGSHSVETSTTRRCARTCAGR